MNPILSSLTPSERDALSTCGILNDGQLAGADVDSLLRDLEMAKSAFPEAAFSLSPDKLRSICAKAAGQQQATTASDERENQAEPKDENEEVLSELLEHDDAEPTRSLPELSLRRHQHRRSGSKRSSNMAEAPGVDSSVHCSRPITTYLAALSMVALYVGLISLLALPFLIFTGYLDSIFLFPCAIAAIALLVPYSFIGIWCHCSVCKMNFFRLVPYNLNRHAHTIPFLGLTTLVTALHIIFRLWYRCPACGTAIRLFRSRHSHHH